MKIVCCVILLIIVNRFAGWQHDTVKSILKVQCSS